MIFYLCWNCSKLNIFTFHATSTTLTREGYIVKVFKTAVTGKSRLSCSFIQGVPPGTASIFIWEKILVIQKIKRFLRYRQKTEIKTFWHLYLENNAFFINKCPHVNKNFIFLEWSKKSHPSFSDTCLETPCISKLIFGIHKEPRRGQI